MASPWQEGWRVIPHGFSYFREDIEDGITEANKRAAQGLRKGTTEYLDTGNRRSISDWRAKSPRRVRLPTTKNQSKQIQ